MAITDPPDSLYDELQLGYHKEGRGESIVLLRLTESYTVFRNIVDYTAQLPPRGKLLS